MFRIKYSYLYYYISLTSFCIPRNSEAKQSSDHHFQSSSGKQSHGSEAIIRSPLTVSPCEVKQPSLLTTTPLHCPSESIPADTCFGDRRRPTEDDRPTDNARRRNKITTHNNNYGVVPADGSPHPTGGGDSSDQGNGGDEQQPPPPPR